MIKVAIYRNDQNEIYGFSLDGHANYAEEGSDIVCAAVTMLVFNTINSIEEFTEDPIEYGYESQGGYLTCLLPDWKNNVGSHDAALLLRSMVFGLKSVKEEYGNYISICDKEV